MPCTVSPFSTTLRITAALIAIALGAVVRADAPKTGTSIDFPVMGVVPKDGGFRMDGYWVWCGSVIQGEDGKYHMFASRWPRNITFHPGWMTDSEVVRAVSDAPLGPYAFVEVVLPARGPEFWDGRATHNPSIQKHGDTYVLFYMGSTNPIGVAPRDERFSLDDPARPSRAPTSASASPPRKASTARGRATTSPCSTRSPGPSTASSRAIQRPASMRTAQCC